MSRICRECKKGRLKITGVGGFEDTILVECPNCGEEYEVEPDGLGEGGLEMLEALQIEMNEA
jgi:hypothetical protein